MKDYRLLVCGGRDFGKTLAEREHFLNQMDALLGFMTRQGYRLIIIEGEAKGADIMTRKWAESHDLEVLKFPANWKKYPKAAGPIRNKQMLDEGKPDAVLAWPGGTGTENMKTQAKAAGVSVVEMSVDMFRY